MRSRLGPLRGRGALLAAALDRASPTAALRALLLDLLLEALQVAPHAPAVEAHGRAQLLDHAFAEVRELEPDPGARRSGLLEADRPAVLLAVIRLPADPLVGLL